jgi:hypothetical protein
MRYRPRVSGASGVWRFRSSSATPKEIADSLGETSAWVSSNLAELRDELRRVGQQWGDKPERTHEFVFLRGLP